MNVTESEEVVEVTSEEVPEQITEEAKPKRGRGKPKGSGKRNPEDIDKCIY